MRFDRFQFLLVLAIALALRLVFVWQWQHSPYALSPFLDAKSYDEWAQAIAGGQWFRGAPFYQSPLYPYVLALIYAVLGHSLALVSALQAVLGALTCGLVFKTTERHFGRQAAFEAGFLAALDRVLIFYTGPTLKETLLVFTLAAFLHFALQLAHRPRRRSALAAGFLLGVSALARGNLLILYGVMPLLLFRRYGLGAWRGPVLFSALGLGAALLPSTLHNLRAGDLVLINSCGGFNFYIGNSPTATGANSYPPFVSTDPAQEERDTARIAAEQSGGRAAKASEVSSHWFRQGLQWIASHPRAWLSLVLHKLWYFWSDQEIPDNYDVEFVAREGGTVLGWPLVTFGWIAVFAIVGWRARAASSAAARWCGWFTLTYMLSAAMFYVTDRYRVPAVVLLLPLAGAGTQALTEFVRAREWRALAARGWPAGIAAALTFWPLPERVMPHPAYSWGVLAGLNSDAGHDVESISAIEKALDLDPSRVSSASFIKASTAYERLGRLREAQEMLHRASELYPHEGLTFFNLGRFRFEHGDMDGAVEMYNKALFVSPYLHQPYIGLGVLYLKTGRLELARESVRRGLLLDPENAQLLQLEKLLQ